MNKTLRQTLLPTLAAAIWGIAFVSQKSAADKGIGPFVLNASRSVVACLFLLAAVALIRLVKRKTGKAVSLTPEEKKKYRKDLFLGGIVCGTFLSIAVNLQQFGVGLTSAGKAGFLTALYTVIVPILSVFSKKKVALPVWIGVMISLLGLYFICVKETSAFTVGDVLLVLCALTFSFQIMSVSHYSQLVNGFELSCVQFALCSIISVIIALFTEKFDLAVIYSCAGEILYIGILSSAVGYTLQILSQKGTNPTIVSLMFSLECLFATLSAAILLNEVLTVKEYIGGALILFAVVLVQLPQDLFKKKKKDENAGCS